MHSLKNLQRRNSIVPVLEDECTVTVTRFASDIQVDRRSSDDSGGRGSLCVPDHDCAASPPSDSGSNKSVAWKRKSLLECIKEIETRRMLEMMLQERIQKREERNLQIKSHAENRRAQRAANGRASLHRSRHDNVIGNCNTNMNIV